MSSCCAWPPHCVKSSQLQRTRHGSGELDLIAFTSLKREVLDLNSHFPPPTEYLRQGWRSLSLVGPTFARVLFAHPDAPDFLRNNLGRSMVFDVGISL